MPPSGAVALRLQHLFEFARKLGRVGVADRKEGIGATGQDIDVESADQPDQGLPHRGVAADQQRVAGAVGGDLAALSDIGLQYFGEVLGRGVAQRDDLGAGADRTRARRRGCSIAAAVIGTMS